MWGMIRSMVGGLA